MNEIICPHCKKAFKIDEAGYADILKQVHDHKFEEELQQRLAYANTEKESAIKLAEATVKNLMQDQITNKDRELAELKAQSALALSQKLNVKDSEITQLKARIDNIDVEKKTGYQRSCSKGSKRKRQFRK